MSKSDLVSVSANLKECLSLIDASDSLDMAFLYADIFSILDKVQAMISLELTRNS